MEGIMSRNLERERRGKMYKGSDGTLTTREAYLRLMAEKRKGKPSQMKPGKTYYSSPPAPKPKRKVRLDRGSA